MNRQLTKEALDILFKTFASYHHMQSDETPECIRASMPTYIRHLEKQYELLMDAYREAYPAEHWCEISHCLNQPVRYSQKRRMWLCQHDTEISQINPNADLN